MTPRSPGHGPIGGHVRSTYIDLASVYDGAQTKVARCTSALASSRAQTLCLITRTSSPLLCLLNGGPARAIGDPARGGFREQLHLLHLRRGRNLLALDSARAAGDWGFTAKLVSMPRAHRLLAEYSLAPLLESRLLKHGEPLRLYYPLCDPTLPVTLTVRDVRGRSVLSRRFVLSMRADVPLSAPRDGLYAATLATPYGHTTETFCVGGLRAEIASVRRRIAARRLSDRVRMQTGAWFYRVRHLCEPEHRNESDLTWQDRVLNVLWNLETVLADARGGEAVLRSPGYRIRAFRSAIDGQPQYYSLIVPHVPKGRKMPLMVMVPPRLLPARPFLDSRIVAVSDDVNRFQALA